MNFCSFYYIVFLLFFTVVYYLFQSNKYQKIILIIASIIFLVVYNLTSFFFFIGTLFLNYIGSMYLEKNKKKKVLFILIVINMALLLIGKFSPPLHIWKAVSNRLPIPVFIVPLGISFYSLALIGYLVDIYNEKIHADRNIVNYSIFCSFFPHIVLGPIARYSQIKSQLDCPHRFSGQQVESGVVRIIWGFFQKLVIADRIGLFVNSVYSSNKCSGSILLIATFLYAIQIFADFAGCVDIAIGSAKLFGIELVENFKMPYFSASISEFWRRWHISLSFWLRDYIYIPLGGNRKGELRKWLNIIIVFIVSGFWHGIGTGFLAWGLIHAVYQIIGSKWKPIKEKINSSLVKINSGWNSKVIDCIITFVLVDFAWIFFRTNSIRKSLSIIKKIVINSDLSFLVDGGLYNFGIDFKSWYVLFFSIIMLFIKELLCYLGYEPWQWFYKQSFFFKWIILFIFIIIIIIFGIYGAGYDAANFIYAQF